MKTSYEVGNTRIEKHKVMCSECTQTTNHTTMAFVDKNWDDQMGILGLDSYEIIQCLGCDTISFRKSSSNNEDYFHNPETGDLETIEYVNIYPPRADGRRTIIRDPDYFQLARETQNIYSETLKAINNNQPVLAGIGLRAIMETVCKDCNAEGRSLFHQINSLVDKSLITKANAETLHEIRALGNSAAHEVRPHTSEQLILAMDIVETLLKQMYLQPSAAQRVFPKTDNV